MTMTPSRRLGFSLPPSPAPLLTPRSEKRPSDLRWADGGSTWSRNDKDREANIQVVLRCRPLNDEEQRLNVQKVISCNEQRKEVSVLQGSVNKQVDRVFTFDRVFGPKSQQRSIYDHAISPIVNDVLDGFNCTVFAYGQTGTGKTYTMEGGMKSKDGELSTDAGVIPRAIRHIIDTLEARKADYSMKVTFLELYNEEITDLLASEDQNKYSEDKLRRPISLMDDGKGGAVIRGLQEEVVYSAHEIYNLLERGSMKRRTADTLLNKQSSRSHSIFSITIHVKEATIGNEELMKYGRLNLIDLAGSENISRSGAREARAREAGEMNKSLLTLGRVITALVEHSGHVPYRDSKLTRLLRESLGGKAKTCIIATISPSIHCLEETLSTLDYAYRAKSIKNKPEANQKLFKSVLLKDLYLEIERLKQDVRAAREKNGVYIPYERYVQDEAEKKGMVEKIDHLEVDLELKRKQSDRFQELYHAEKERNLDLESEIRDCKATLEDSKLAYIDLEEVYKTTMLMLEQKEFIISDLQQSEHAILQQAKELRVNLEDASKDISMFYIKIERQKEIETGNQALILAFGSQLDQSIKTLHQIITDAVYQQHQTLRSMEERITSFIASKCEATESLELRIEKIKKIYSAGIQGMKELASTLQKKASSDLEEIKSTISAQMMAVENFLVTAVSEAEQIMNDVLRSLKEQKALLDYSAQQQESGLQRSLVSTQVISKTTIDFFNAVHSRASRLITILEENQMERSHRFEVLEKSFRDLSAKEEKAALEKIAEILTNLTATKANMVSEALKNMNYTGFEATKRLQLEMSDMQQVTSNAKKDWIVHLEKVESQYQDDMFSTAETKTTMDDKLQSCLKKVTHSIQHWHKSQLSIDQLNEGYAAEIESSVETRNQENANVLEEFMTISSSTDVDFSAGTYDLLTTANDSLSLDHKARREIESVSKMCSDNLTTLQADHSTSESDMIKLADRFLRKEYLVDHPSGSTPKKPTIIVPSLASIEGLRAPSLPNIVKMGVENITKGEAEGKQQHYLLTQTARNPLTTIN